MRKILFIILSFTFLSGYSFNCDSSARSYVNTYIRTNGTRAITGNQLNLALNKILDADSCSFSRSISTTILNDSINELRKTRKVDTIYRNSDSLVYKINGKRYAIISATSGGGIDSVYYFRTIQQLRNQMASHTLKSGRDYLATDFTTIYDQPNYASDYSPITSGIQKTASIEHLVFHANSDSTFDNYVSSIDFPTDIIKFDWTFTETEVTNTPAKGRISYREDIKGNICEYDFRKVLFKRYRQNGLYSSLIDNDSVSAEFLTFVDYEHTIGNVMTGYVSAYLTYGDVITFDFLLPNIVFNRHCVKNKLDIVYNSTFMDDCNENFFGDGTQFFTSIGGIYYSYFGHGAALFNFLGESENNYFGDGGFAVTFGDRCQDNSIWDKMENFSAGTDFKRNIQYGNWTNSTVGNSFTDGVVYGNTDSIYAGDNNFKIEIKSGIGITIGNNNSNISFGGAKHIFSLNNINSMTNVSFSGGIDGVYWTNGIGIAYHPELYGNFQKYIIKASNGSVYTRYFNGSTDATNIIN